MSASDHVTKRQLPRKIKCSGVPTWQVDRILIFLAPLPSTLEMPQGCALLDFDNSMVPLDTLTPDFIPEADTYEPSLLVGYLR
jgi:hypothetical protein